MKVNVFEFIEKKLDEVSPGVLTGLSIASMIGTVLYSVWAGYQIAEILNEEDTEPIEKAKKIVPVAAPIIVGATFSGATGYLAHKKHLKAAAATASMLAMYQKDNKYLQTFKDKAEEKLGVKKSEEVHHETEGAIHAMSNQPPMGYLTKWLDEVTGFTFWATPEEVDVAAEVYNEEFNNLGEDDQREGLPISRFYEILLGGKYVHMRAHEDYGLKYDGVLSFRPNGRNRQGHKFEDGVLGWKIDYEISDLRIPDILVG